MPLHFKCASGGSTSSSCLLLREQEGQGCYTVCGSVRVQRVVLLVLSAINDKVGSTIDH